MMPMRKKFNDDIFARFLVIIENVISFIKEYRGTTLRPNDAYASVKWVSMCSDIGLSLSGCQAINRTNVDLQ